MLPALDRVALNINVTINVLSLIANALLMWIILFRTPVKMRTFAVLLLNTNICDTLISVCAMATNPKIASVSNALIFVAYGPCKYSGASLCFVFQKIHFHFLIHTLISQFLAFAYRYYILVQTRTPTKTLLATLCFLVSLPTLALLIVHFLEHCPSELLLTMMKEKDPQKDFSHTAVYGYFDWRTPSVLASLVYMALPTIPLYILIGFLKKKIEDVLEKRRRMMKRASLLMHAQLLKVLTLQSYTPFLMTIAVVLFLVNTNFEALNNVLDEHLISTCTDLYPLCNAIITIRYIGPYRRTFNHLFWTKRTRHPDRYLHIQYPSDSRLHTRSNNQHSPTRSTLITKSPGE